MAQEVAIMSSLSTAEPGFAGRTLADIASTLPGATKVFRQYKLDFCCGGRVSLADAAAARGVALPKVERELQDVARSATPSARPDGVEDLIALIETRYHAVHRRELQELIKLARRVEAVHRAHPAAPHGIGDLLAEMAGELEVHMKKEELILFPLMRRGGHPMISQPIQAMMAEHDDHGAQLRRLEQVTHDYSLPDDACPTWRALYVGARKLADDLMEHIHIENNVLFPRFAG
jgi:regulator of cell morphogenesis and NO signaling